jgi:hypothetical protein
MTIRRNRLLALSLLMTVLCTSCLEGFDERAFYSANIIGFSFAAHDTCPDIEDYVFNIDQFHGVPSDRTSGKIFNLDSLPVGRVVNSLRPSITMQSSNDKVYVGDSLWDSKDSLDFSHPVIIQNTSYDGLYTKRYTVTINVHQVEPDSMQLYTVGSGLPFYGGSGRMVESTDGIYYFTTDTYNGFAVARSSDTCKSWVKLLVAGMSSQKMRPITVNRFKSKFYALSETNQAYVSDNGATWAALTPTSAGNPVTLLGLFGAIARNPKLDSLVLAGMMRTGSGETVFATSTDGLNWIAGAPVPASFPFRYYGITTNRSVTGIQRLTLLGGEDESGTMHSKVWVTENGTNWAWLDEGGTSYLKTPVRREPQVFFYDGKLVCYGGKDDQGELSNSLFLSPDGGLSWMKAPAKWAMTRLNPGISGAAVYVQRVPDAKNEVDREFIWLAGGNVPATTSTVWKAFLNRMIFERR